MQNKNYNIDDIIFRIKGLAKMANEEEELFISLYPGAIMVGHFTLESNDLSVSYDDIDEVLYSLINMGAYPYDHASNTVYFDNPAVLLAGPKRN